MRLSKESLDQISPNGIAMPQDNCFQLPEKVLQFGTGVLLRGLPDYFIDKANKEGIFNGRIVVVKSTSNGGTDAFAKQDGLFTHYTRGFEQGVRKEETIINSSISRVLSASEDWQEILSCASNEAMQLVFSNTTEIGLTLLPGDNLKALPPISFPGKLTAFLYARYQAFQGAEDRGLVIIPTELIPDNGAKLRSICVALARQNSYPEKFIDWLTRANDFCNSLVDCIVPGRLPEVEAKAIADRQGFEDELHITSESYRLWAIETSRQSTRDLLSFSGIDEGVIITANIDKFRELKLRLLNGAHTFTCGLAVLSDFNTVKEAMSNSFFEGFIKTLMHDEIEAAITGKTISEEEAKAFTDKVLDRFRNPFIEHQWLSISVQYTSKMGMRCVPTLIEYYKRHKRVPKHMAAGFGAYILFMRSQKTDEGFTARNCGMRYIIQDDKAAVLHDKWRNANTAEEVVRSVLSDEILWQTDLTKLPGFEKAVLATVRNFLEQNNDASTHRTAILAA